MNFTVVFKEANWLPWSARQFKGQARSFYICISIEQETYQIVAHYTK